MSEPERETLGGYDDLPAEAVRADQIVAMNIRYWRRAAGLTQGQLGERLGWSDANVSGAERSASSDREPRRFDAGTLTALASAIGVPIAAFFLPPEDDGLGKRYTVAAGLGPAHSMGDLMSLAVSDPSDDDTPVMRRYRERYSSAQERHFDPGRRAEIRVYLDELNEAEQRQEALKRLQWERDALVTIIGDIDHWADAIRGEDEEQ